ncbi:biotin sulfoxide reductase [Klebsiella pneumoniae]|nr:biotin sulfoxide reductase [Klebsiella pneumoniae]
MPQVNGGGANDHMLQYWLDKMRANGTRFINISPVRNDLSAVPDAEWLAIRPGTDTALLLALSYVLIAESLYDQAFIASHTVGFAPYCAYLLGEHDGVAKTPAWAAAITGLDAQRIADLAREMARHRTMVNISWSIQRARQGEQAYWATVALTALLGQLGTPGGGLGFGYACTNLAGAVRKAFSGPRLPAGENAVDSVIPVARLSDMLLHPGETYEFRRSAAALSRYPFSLLGGRQCVSSIIRISTDCARPGAARRRWWCMSSTGPRRPNSPISFCRPPPRWSERISAAAVTTGL